MTGTRRCARPGCGGDVAAWLSYDYAGQRIWLDDPAAEIAGHHSGLCAAHAGRLRPPVGWSCLDRRTARPPNPYPLGGPIEPAAVADPTADPTADDGVEPGAPAPPTDPPGPVTSIEAGDDTAGMAVIAV